MDRRQRENPRYSRRLRAKAVEKSTSPGNKGSGNADDVLLEKSLERPEYRPELGIVMSAEQLDVLRRQIATYASICQQLVEMHKASMAAAASSNPNGTSSSRRTPAPAKSTTTRHRWAPSQAQIQFLEKLYDEGIGTPHRDQVREITAELSQHGAVTDNNVYNWFQNRKARTRRWNRKQSALGKQRKDEESEEEEEEGGHAEDLSSKRSKVESSSLDEAAPSDQYAADSSVSPV